MPPACPVDRYVPATRDRKCYRLARWIVTFLATRTARATWNATGLPGGSLRSSLHGQLRPGMPPACPVDYVPATGHGSWNATGWPGGSLHSSLHRTARAIWNATGLPGGSLRSSLHGQHRATGMPPACPVDRYVPRYTRTASNAQLWNATGLPGGSLRSSLHRTAIECHRLAGGSLRLATGSPGMPPACPVDRYVPRYSS